MPDRHPPGNRARLFRARAAVLRRSGSGTAGPDVVDVEASQWQFNFKYPNGAESNELYLLVDRPTVLKLVSKDVTHALYIPAFRVQRNAVPGQDTQIWFTPTVTTDKDPATGEEGFYHVFCTQYCGNGHAEMNTKAFVLNQADYDKKLAEAANIFVKPNTKPPEPVPYVDVGKKLYTTMGCSQCHSFNGAKGTGPTWKGLYKSDVAFSKSNEPGYALEKSDDDKKWDDYLRESILHPEVKIVQDFQNVMPSQESAFSGSPYKEKKLQAIIEYIKSLGDPADYKPMKTPETTSGEKPQGEGREAASGKNSNQRQAAGRGACRSPVGCAGQQVAESPAGREERRRKMIARPAQHSETCRTRQLPDAQPRRFFLALHARPQANRRDVPDLRTRGLFPGRHVRHADPRAIARSFRNALP